MVMDNSRVAVIFFLPFVIALSGCEILKQDEHPAKPEPVVQQNKTLERPPEKAALRNPKLSPVDQMMRVALDMRGKPFLFQGETPEGFDASGLVYYSHKQVGLDIPRSFQQQLNDSQTVEKDKLIPGDLVFFSLGSTKATHVGIYLGVNKFIHAPPNKRNVILSDLSKGFWADNLLRGGRYNFRRY